jgi:hypothetical protein
MKNGGQHKLQQSIADCKAVLPENQYCDNGKLGITETMITADFHQSLMLNMTKNQTIHTFLQNHGGITHTSLLTYEVVVVWKVGVPLFQINILPTFSVLKII